MLKVSYVSTNNHKQDWSGLVMYGQLYTLVHLICDDSY